MFADFLSQLTVSAVSASLSVCVLAYFVAEWLWFRIHYDWHKIPGPPLWPIVGDLPAFIRFGKGDTKLHQYNHYLWEKLGRPKMYKRERFGRRFLVITDPAFVQNEVTGRHGLEKSPIYGGFMKLFGPSEAKNIVVRQTHDEKWRSVRKNVAQAFSTENLKKTLPKVLSTSHQVIDELAKLPAGEAIDIRKVMALFTFEVISSWGMGVQTDAIETRSNPLLDSVVNCSDEVVRESVYPWRKFVKKWLPFAAMAKKTRQDFKGLYAAIDDLYSKMDASLTGDEHSIASALLKAKNAPGDKALSEAELKSEAIAFFLAGTDTTAQQLTWTLCFLACNKDIQSKLAQEVRDAGYCGPDAKELTYDDLRSLPYTNAVIKESMRFQPVAANGSSRILEKDATLLGHRIPKNTMVVGPQFTMNRLHTVYENPEKFDPDRWLGNELPHNQHDPETGIRKIWIFSNGPRDCVGQRLAILEMQVMLPLIVGEFNIELDERMGGWEGVMDKKYDKLVTNIRGGMWVKVSRRD